MAAPKRPHWIRLRDLLTLGLTAAVAVGLAIWVGGAELQSATPGKTIDTGAARATMYVVAGCFVAIYTFVLIRRKRELDQYTYVAQGERYAFMVNPGEFKGEILPKDVLQLADMAFDGWSTVYGKDEVKDFADDKLFWVTFKPWPVNNPSRGKDVKVAGYARNHMMVVAYKGEHQDLDATAFRHELGHLIQGHFSQSWDEDEHHARAKEHGLR